MNGQPTVEHVGTRDGESGVAALCRELLVRVAAGGWDQHALIATLARSGDGWGLMPLPISEAIWHAYRDPIRLLEVLPIALAGMTLAATPDLYAGHAFLAEGWGFNHDRLNCKPSGSTLEDFDCEHRRWIESGRRIADHPDGVEQRDVTALTRDGQIVWVSHRRGGEPEVMFDTETSTTAEGKVGGRVIEALRAIVAAAVEGGQLEEEGQ